jgi:hypothetical protein
MSPPASFRKFQHSPGSSPKSVLHLKLPHIHKSDSKPFEMAPLM